MTECVDAFPLNEKIHIIRPHREKNTQNAYLDTTDKEELIKDRKRRIYSARKRGAQLLKETEKTDIIDTTYKLMVQNRAVQSHLIAFCGLTSIGRKNDWFIGYGEYRKRIKRKAIPQEVQHIKTWWTRHTENNLSALSFGLWVQGYFYLFFIITDKEKTAVHDLAIKLAQYVRRKKYTPIVLRPMEKDPIAFIKDKYNNDTIWTAEELFEHLGIELTMVMRGSFALPYQHHTLCSKRAKKALKEAIKTEKVNKVYMSPACLQKYNNTRSAIMEKDTDNDYFSPNFWEENQNNIKEEAPLIEGDF